MEKGTELPQVLELVSKSEYSCLKKKTNQSGVSAPSPFMERVGVRKRGLGLPTEASA